MSRRRSIAGELLDVARANASEKAAGILEAPIAYLLPAEVATILRVSTKTVYRLAGQDPTMPCLRLGGSLRFPREKLFRWLASREQGAGRSRRVVPIGRSGGEGAP